uniref:Protein kinase domain-containing protein n=1 Tax=Arcella intermedia TaxID=1963864 RepID=A0A6B2LN39_9EUKA
MAALAKQAINILHGIHERGIVHNDIKPEHLVIKDDTMYLIDYGCSGPIGIPSKLETPKFASYFGFESEKKDFESLWYSFLSLCMKLPWDKNEIQELEELNLRLKYSPENQLKAFPQIAPIFSELLN